MVLEITAMTADAEGTVVFYRVIGGVTGYARWLAQWMPFTWQSLCERLGEAILASLVGRKR